MAKRYELLPGGANHKGLSDFVNIVKLPEKITTKDTFVVPQGYIGLLYYGDGDEKSARICGRVEGAFHFDEKTFTRIKFKRGLFSKKVDFSTYGYHFSFFIVKPLPLPWESKEFADVAVTRSGFRAKAFVHVGGRFVPDGEPLYDWKHLLRYADLHASRNRIESGQVYTDLFWDKQLGKGLEDFLERDSSIKPFLIPKGMLESENLYSTLNMPEEAEKLIAEYMAKTLKWFGINAHFEFINPNAQ